MPHSSCEHRWQSNLLSETNTESGQFVPEYYKLNNSNNNKTKIERNAFKIDLDPKTYV